MKQGLLIKRAGIFLLALGLALQTAAGSNISVFATTTEDGTESSEPTASDEELLDESRDVIEKSEKVVRTIETGTLEIAVKKYTFTCKLGDGRTYQELSYEYPVVLDDSSAAAAINKYYLVKRAAWIKNARQYTQDARNAVLALSDPEDGRHYSDNVTLTVMTNDGTYFCTMQEGSEYTMGAHGLPYRICYTFHAKTGKRVTSGSILGLTKKQVNAKVRKLYLKKYDKTVNTKGFQFFEGRELLVKSMRGVDFSKYFYVKKNRLYFYADPYLLGPYAAGFIEVATAVK